jgi:hypothetical protein
MSDFKIETKDGPRGARVATLPGWAAMSDGDPRWRSWTCPTCRSTHAGYNVNTRAVACSGCVARIRENKAIGLSPEELWREALAEAARAELCGVCGQKVGAVPEDQERGRSVICRRCLAGAAA